MTTEYSGTGDPKRSMELLWGVPDRPRRGPKPKLTVARIVRAAIEIADAEGLAGLSMRRVADQLGVTAMSLYTYVPGKGELLDVMLDTVYGEDADPDTPEGDGGSAADWRAGLERLARQNYERYQRHPWLLQVASSRPVLGPNLMARWDRELAAVEGLDLTEIEMDLVITLLADYVHGAVRGAIEMTQAERRTGMTDEQWWRSYEPLLEQVFDAERFPVAARVGEVTGEEYQAAADPARSFEFGLQRVLDGIGTLVRARAAEADERA
ncbi:TetR/AcrR family transcriptional regulator [Plantactinospora sonchi]|uniref:TetR/AcrR family transcriptional regulator n=1 Tax=Plantactinospora sonchi TaxID=1544735 RepID=A0ABU7RUR4_9ACTN